MHRINQFYFKKGASSERKEALLERLYSVIANEFDARYPKIDAEIFSDDYTVGVEISNFGDWREADKASFYSKEIDAMVNYIDHEFILEKVPHERH